MSIQSPLQNEALSKPARPEPRPRVLYLASGRSVAGNAPGRKIASIVGCWRASGADVMLVCGGDVPGGCGAAEAGRAGSMDSREKWYRQVRLLAPVVRSVSERRDIAHHAATIEHLDRLVHRFSPHLIWERSSRLHGAGLVVARRIGVPYVLEWKDHLVPYRLSLHRGRAVRMEKWKNREADVVVVESEVLRRQLVGEGVRPDKILVAQNAVDPGQFRREESARCNTRQALGIDDSTVLVGYLGSYAFYHDAARLVLAAELVRRQGRADIRFLMVGAGQEYPHARHLAESRGLLGSTVIMKPAVPPEQVPGILSALDVAVLPGSTDIICPIKVQEYMAAELPTVLPDYPANREVVDHGTTGMLFAPKNEESLAATIVDLARDPAGRKRLGREARRTVRNRFTWEKTWGAVLSTVVSKGD